MLSHTGTSWVLTINVLADELGAAEEQHLNWFVSPVK